MATRSQTYAIRLAVEGGGQVKAELVAVGQSGEQSLKRIETGASAPLVGLKGLGRQAELLRTGIRTLGGALAGIATVGGWAALVDRSISAADAIGKTADKIGVGVEALRELRFAAKASGVVQQKSLRTLRYELDLASSTIEKLEGRIQELRESPTLGFTTFLDTAQISALERKLDELQPPAWSLPNAKWRGAVIYRSGDGISFTDYSAVTTSALWAKAKTVLPAHERWGIWDEDNALDLLVQSPGLEFESKTELEVLDGANLLLVGQEIIQFADAEQLGASEWRVSKLLRGRRGTEWAMSTHQVGEIVLALDPATLIRVSSLDEVGLSRLYRAVSIGSDPSLPEAVSFTNEAAPAPVMKTRSMGMSFLH